MDKIEPQIILHNNDLPADILHLFDGPIGVDTETMGLQILHNRLCLVQLSTSLPNSTIHLVKFDGTEYNAPNLCSILADPSKLKIFHFARFDVAVLYHYLGVECAPVFCTKIASKLVRTYTDNHSLKTLCRDFLKIELSKQKQISDWGASELCHEQLTYAARDVLYLHQLRDRLHQLLVRESKLEIAENCFNFLPARAKLDLMGWADQDIFAHSV